ncbi:MAG: phosphoglycerate kinase, partial [Phycisphaerae bacterium]|nr:phosphoglycerate kinase [Phycisphaerae bacterium]
MTTKTIADIDVAGKKVLMRVDFNVPLDNGKVTNDKRIVAALPSIKHVLDGGAALILMSHLGRPKGQVKPELSLKPVADRLAELLDRSVTLGPPEVVGPGTEELVAAMKPGNVVLLENVRFHPGETMPDKAKKNPDGQLAFDQRETLYGFVQELGRLGEVYVNDAFGTCHRKHASMYGAAKVIKAKGGPSVAGFLVEKEIKYLHDAISDPAKPFVVILGGAKVSDKI